MKFYMPMKQNSFFYLTAVVFIIIHFITGTFPSFLAAQEVITYDPAGEDCFSVQIGAFSKKAHAEAFAARLRETGQPVYIVKENQDLYKVRFGKYKAKAEAKNAAWLFSTREKMPCIIIGPLKNKAGGDADIPCIPSDTEKKKEYKNRRNDSITATTPQSATVEADSTLLPHSKEMPEYPNSHFSFFERLSLKMYAALDPKFTYRLCYEDNVANAIEGEASDFSKRYTPELSLSINSDRFSIVGSSELEIIEYFHERELNTVDQDHTFTINLTPGARSILILSYNYTVNTDPNRYFETAPGEGGSLALEGAYTVKKYKTKTSTYSLSYDYKLSPRSGMSTNLSYAVFDTGATDNSKFYYAAIKYTYELSRATKANLNFTYNKFDFSFSGAEDTQFLEDLVTEGYYTGFFGSQYKMKNYNVSGGLKHTFPGDITVDLSLGWKYDKNDILQEITDPQTDELISTSKKADGDGITASFKTEKVFSLAKINFNFTCGTGSNANTGASYDQTQTELRYYYYLTHLLTGSVLVRYNIYKSDQSDYGFEIDRRILGITSIFSYNYSKWLSCSLTYSYTKDHNKISHNVTKRNTVFLSLVFKPLRPFIFR